MATEQSISIEFKQAKKGAAKIESCADELLRIVHDMDNLTQDLRGGWEGESADLFIGKCERLEKRLNNNVRYLDQLAITIRSMAKSYYDAEMEALRAANEDTSGG